MIFRHDMTFDIVLPSIRELRQTNYLFIQPTYQSKDHMTPPTYTFTSGPYRRLSHFRSIHVIVSGSVVIVAILN
jgi:hypothetical protein